jgi:fibronectin-binding autotransporter adhesin
VKNCYVTGTVNGSENVGGVVGLNQNGNVENCYVTGTVSGTDKVGGVVGNNYTGGIVRNCYTTGNISGNGVVGNNEYGKVQNCVALNPNISGNRVANDGTMTNNYGRSDMTKNGAPTTWAPTGPNSINGESITATNWEDANWWTSTAGFNTGENSGVWTIENGKLPILNNMPEGVQNPAIIIRGNADTPFLVYTPEDLSHVGNPVAGTAYAYWGLDKHYKQMENIDLNSVSNWTPIGISNPFTGSYDGGGHIIKNLRITFTGSSMNFLGLFSSVSSTAMVENLGIEDIIITDGQSSVGGIVGNNAGTVQNCYVTGNVSGNRSNIGGVVGQNSGTVQYCYTTCAVTVNPENNGSSGGVVGFNDGTVQYCYATGIVSGKDSAGGVVGFINTKIVQNCVALNPNIIGNNNYLGRVTVQLNGSGTLIKNYGRKDMKKNGTSTTWDPIEANTINGADITSTDWESKSWWTVTAGFSEVYWTIENGSRLPILKGFPSGSQNPSVTN